MISIYIDEGTFFFDCAGDWCGSATVARETKTTEPTTTTGAFMETPYGGLLFITIVLVSFIMVWWKAGGRVVFRRNESGWGIGFQVIPPSWSPPARDRMTKEEVLSLPEISFDHNHRNDGTSLKETNIKDRTAPTTTNDKFRSKKRRPNSISIPLSPATQTNNVTCIICLEDFQDGEMIRLLPRCGHAMHTNCILPWLTESHGCCPICKTRVIATLGSNENFDEETGPGE
jgi:hypothetical protein